MRIVSWNVNGLQTTLKDATHRFTNASIYFTTILHADVVCFQEAKIQEEKLEKWMACVPGFESFWAFSQAKKGYSGVVTYVKDELSPLDAAAEKLPCGATVTEDLCREGRVIETDHGNFVLINVYVPNAGDRGEGRPRLDFKVRFLQALKQKCDEVVSSGRHVVVVGDFNIAHKAIDVHKKWNVEEIYSSEENAWLDNFLTEYVDLFRHFHPDAKDVFSVWETKTDARIHNEGLRIDYAVCDKGFLTQVKDTQILKMVPKNWSDHAAVVLTLQEQPALPPHPSPLISSRNMKQFQEDRRQKKLTSLFSRGASKPMTTSTVGGAVPKKHGNLDQSNAGASDPVTVNSGDSGPKPSGAAVENLEQCAELHQEVVSPAHKVPVSSQDILRVTHDDQHSEAVGGNGNLGGQFLVATVNDTDNIQSVQQDQTSFDQKIDCPSVQGKNGEAQVDALTLKEEVLKLASGLQPESDVLTVAAETEGNSPNKRKQPPAALVEIGGPVGKQRNLTSYFKVATRDSGVRSDDQSM